MPLPEEIENEMGVYAKQQISLGKKTAHKIGGIGMQGLYIETEVWISLPLPSADPQQAVEIYQALERDLTDKSLAAIKDAQQKAAQFYVNAIESYDHEGVAVKVTPALPEKGSTASKTVYTPAPPKPQSAPLPFPTPPAGPKIVTPPSTMPAIDPEYVAQALGAEELSVRMPERLPILPEDRKPVDSDGSNFDPALKVDKAPRPANTRKPGQWWFDRATRFEMRGVMIDFFVANPAVKGAIGSIKDEVYESMGLPSLKDISEKKPLLLTLQVTNKLMTEGLGKGNYRVNVVGARYVEADDQRGVQPEAEEDVPF